MLFAACEKNNNQTGDDPNKPTVPTTDTVRFQVNDIPHFVSQLPMINTATLPDTNYVIVSFGNLGFTQAQKDLLINGVNGWKTKSNVELRWAGVYASESGVNYTFSEHEQTKQPKAPAYTTTGGYKIMIPVADWSKFVSDGTNMTAFDTVKGNEPPELQHRDTIFWGAKGDVMDSVLSAKVIVLTQNGSDVKRFEEIINNWNVKGVELIVPLDDSLIGGRYRISGLTPHILKHLSNPNDKPPEAKIHANRAPVITTYSPRNWFNKNQSVCGAPVEPLRIAQLGDEGVTNWELAHIARSGTVANNNGPYTGQDLVPHVESTNADGKIYFEPGRHFVNENDPNRSNYMPEWFGNRANWFNFATENNLKIVIEMKKLHFRSSNIVGTNAQQNAGSSYQTMIVNFMNQPNIELPTLSDVVATVSSQRTRGP
jgi:hypothetical protein